MKQLERAIEKVSMFFSSFCKIFVFFGFFRWKNCETFFIIYVYAVKIVRKVMLSNGGQ